jgi:hypothetical protein
MKRNALCRSSWLLACITLALVPARADIYGAGSGGLLLNPTADMPAKGQLTPSALAIPQEGPGAVGGSRTLASYGISYGLSENISIGATHLRLNPTRGVKAEPSNGASIKVRLLKGKTDGRPDVVVGGGFLSGGDLDAQFGFVTARFATESGIKDRPAHLHVGVMYADDLWGAQRKEAAAFVGVNVPLAKNLEAFAEIRQRMKAVPVAQSDVHPPTAVGLVWSPIKRVKIFGGVATNGQSREYRPSIGVGYTVGVGK